MLVVVRRDDVDDREIRHLEPLDARVARIGDDDAAERIARHVLGDAVGEAVEIAGGVQREEHRRGRRRRVEVDLVHGETLVLLVHNPHARDAVRHVLCVDFVMDAKMIDQDVGRRVQRVGRHGAELGRLAEGAEEDAVDEHLDAIAIVVGDEDMSFVVD